MHLLFGIDLQLLDHDFSVEELFCIVLLRYYFIPLIFITI